MCWPWARFGGTRGRWPLPDPGEKPCRELSALSESLVQDRRVIGELETMEAHDNSQAGIRASPPKRGRFRVPAEGHLHQGLQWATSRRGWEPQENCCHPGEMVG